MLSNSSFEIVSSFKESMISLLISACLSLISFSFTSYLFSVDDVILFNSVEIAQVNVRQIVMIDVGDATIYKLFLRLKLPIGT